MPDKASVVRQEVPPEIVPADDGLKRFFRLSLSSCGEGLGVTDVINFLEVSSNDRRFANLKRMMIVSPHRPGIYR